LQKAVDYLNQYLIEESQESDLAICAHHLRKAMREIGFVSGKVSSDRILDVIFADFRVGK
jgi:tRNA U34 5-carboxymethylaminomethyl modifying GTPase MnmE/TrmE